MSTLQTRTTAPGKARRAAKGKPRPEKLKLTIGQMEGYITEQFFFFSWPYAYV